MLSLGGRVCTAAAASDADGLDRDECEAEHTTFGALLQPVMAAPTHGVRVRLLPSRHFSQNRSYY